MVGIFWCRFSFRVSDYLVIVVSKPSISKYRGYILKSNSGTTFFSDLTGDAWTTEALSPPVF